MKLKGLKSVLYSSRGSVQFVIVYDSEKDMDLENGCTAEAAIKNHGEKDVKRIQALDDLIVITV